ncbi:hypothetical protein [Micromonospora sp. NPDC005707]|uniref:hypothetical protein n=1 Tax=Micromonospora sp. NPDC005707 TaxID=3157050 RepID=UPI00340C0CD1
MNGNRLERQRVRSSQVTATVRGFAVGPANYAGQAHQWARAVQRVFGVPAVAFAFPDRLPFQRGGFRFPVDRRLPHHRVVPGWGRVAWTRHRVLRGVTHLAVDAFLPVYGRPGLVHIDADYDRLRRDGLAVALISHGTDLRDPEAHIRRHPFSYYASAPQGWVATTADRARQNRQIARELGAPLFVSTPDLLLDAGWATWLPVSIDPVVWAADGPALRDRVPTVLHRPSRTSPPIKGTEIIEPVLLDLARRGRIRYLNPGLVPNEAMPELIARADVVVDQILTGSYGVAAVEAMAAGRLVVGYVGEETTAVMPEPPPIVNAPPATFADVMAGIVDDRERYAGLAAQGPGFVRRWHDGTAAAEALRPFLS